MKRGQSHVLWKGKGCLSSFWAKGYWVAPECADAFCRNLVYIYSQSKSWGIWAWCLYHTEHTVLFAIHVLLGSWSHPCTVLYKSQVWFLLNCMKEQVKWAWFFQAHREIFVESWLKTSILNLTSFSLSTLGSTATEKAPAMCPCHGRTRAFWSQGVALARQRGESPRYHVTRWKFPTGAGSSTDFGEIKSSEAQNPNVNLLPPH